MTEAELNRSSNIAWRTSSYSANGGDCVEIGWDTTDTLVRDSKDPDGGLLALPAHGWHAFLATL
ncbi:DUF397 domain-containing protein [Haloechinothrix sp. LS1_15]|uniref:DUF397 domain-containing protein n=1 Tax=Haloechinothrix sp. LS1_15 TaxID=2652248 RepID=UPI0029455FC0|nr:DUF397 domain-containing protein [Haloechinothrix sp. LS1_15]MDV6014708.1 DUF397 domain-containing protein [Haloechinothrix sp. LS1_15]